MKKDTDGETTEDCYVIPSAAQFCGAQDNKHNNNNNNNNNGTSCGQHLRGQRGESEHLNCYQQLRLVCFKIRIN